MGFPTSLDKSAPADTDNPSAGAAQIRNLKIFLEDLFGIQDAVNYSAAPFAIGQAGQLTIAQTRMLFQTGNATTPSFAFAGATSTGLAYDGATTAIAVLRNGVKVGHLGIPTRQDMGGTGQDSSAWTGVPYVTAGAWSSEGQVSPLRGGTGESISGTGYLHFLSGTASLVGSTFALGGHLFGLTLSNSTGDATNDIDIGVGECTSDDVTETERATLYVSTAFPPYTKQLDAVWAAGDNAGMRIATEPLADGTWHIYVFQRAGLSSDICASQSIAPTLPDGGQRKRRIGSLLREGGSIVAFSQDGDEFLRAGSLAVKETTSGTSAVTRVMEGVPDGIVVNALLRIGIYSSATADAVLVTALSQPDESPSVSTTPYVTAISGSVNTHDTKTIAVRTNTSRQVRTRQSTGGATETLIMVVYGWIDTRGRLA